jgi:hypothetical protein
LFFLIDRFPETIPDVHQLRNNAERQTVFLLRLDDFRGETLQEFAITGNISLAAEATALISGASIMIAFISISLCHIPCA